MTMSAFLPTNLSDLLCEVDAGYDCDSANVIANLAFDSGVDLEIAECFAEDAGLAFGGGFQRIKFPNASPLCYCGHGCEDDDLLSCFGSHYEGI